jgi:hypothetical protein
MILVEQTERFGPIVGLHHNMFVNGKQLADDFPDLAVVIRQ